MLSHFGPLDFPQAGLVLDSQGNLFGTTDGDLLDDMVFEVAAGSEHHHHTRPLRSRDWFYRNGGLVEDSHGNLLARCQVADGSIFEVAAGSGTVTDLACASTVPTGCPQRPGCGR